MQTFHRLVSKNLGRRLWEELSIYIPYSGVTTNQSETMNRVNKDPQELKEALANALFLSLFRLQAYYYNEIQRVICGLGEYRLKTTYAFLSKKPGEVEYLSHIAKIKL